MKVKQLQEEVIKAMFKTFAEDYKTYLRMKEFIESEKGQKFLKNVEILKLAYAKRENEAL